MDKGKLIKVIERKYDRQGRMIKKYDDLDHESFTDRDFRILDKGMHLGSMLAYEMALITIERMSKDDRNE